MFRSGLKCYNKPLRHTFTLFLANPHVNGGKRITHQTNLSCPEIDSHTLLWHVIHILLKWSLCVKLVEVKLVRNQTCGHEYLMLVVHNITSPLLSSVASLALYEAYSSHCVNVASISLLEKEVFHFTLQTCELGSITLLTRESFPFYHYFLVVISSSLCLQCSKHMKCSGALPCMCNVITLQYDNRACGHMWVNSSWMMVLTFMTLLKSCFLPMYAYSLAHSCTKSIH